MKPALAYDLGPVTRWGEGGAALLYGQGLRLGLAGNPMVVVIINAVRDKGRVRLAHPTLV